MTSSAEDSSLVCIVDDNGTILLADKDSEGIVGEIQTTQLNSGPDDILQQALAEVNSGPQDQNEADTLTLYVEQPVPAPPAPPAPPVVRPPVSQSAEDVLTLYRAQDGSLHLVPDQTGQPNSIPKVGISLPDVVLAEQSNSPKFLLAPSQMMAPGQTLAPCQVSTARRKSDLPAIIGKRNPPLPQVANVAKTFPTYSVMLSPNPVMITKPTPTKPPPSRTLPLILPKPQVQGAKKVAEPSFVMQGSTFYTKQSLSNSQLSQVAKVLRKKLPANSKEDTTIVVDEEKGPKTTYTIVFREDMDEMKAASAIAEKEASESSEDSDSEEAAHQRQSSSQTVEFYPHEIISQALVKKMQDKEKRKRGRPRREASVDNERPEVHAKRLRREFGLTISQLQVVSKDIVSDKMELGSQKGQPETELDDDDDDETMKVQLSRTRSGRISKPPAGKTETYSTVATASNGRKDLTSNDLGNQTKVKRKLHVPDKYRCRVCHKMYLGDKKMNKHMKLFPSHGPPPESLFPAVASSEACKSLPVSHPGSVTKMSDYSVPIIPLARTQLEELVKNLDAELVLDVIAKKMFNNFSMWQLEKKRLSLLPDQGLKRLEKLLSNLEDYICDVKKLVDNCLTSTKLHDNASSSFIQLGDNCQAALNLHEGPWYMEDYDHISEENHKLLDLQPISDLTTTMSPRSDSNTTHTLGLPMDEEDNSNSMLSVSSDRGGHGLGAQMVLERNLAAPPIDEDTQDGTIGKKGFSDSKHDSSPNNYNEEDDSNMSNMEVDPKKVLEQNGINISASEDMASSIATSHPHHSSANDLQQEIDSLAQFPTSAASTHSYQRTRLPSFSSIIGGSPKTSLNEQTASSENIVSTASDATSDKIADLHQELADVLAPVVQHPSYVSAHSDPDPPVPSPSSDILTGASGSLHELKQQLNTTMKISQATSSSNSTPLITHPDLIPIQSLADFHHEASGPPSVGHNSHISESPSMGPLSHVSDHHSHVSGPPSIDQHQVLPSTDSVLEVHRAGSLPNSPRVDFHHQHSHSVPPSGPPSVDVKHISNPASIDPHHQSIPNSPLNEFIPKASDPPVRSTPLVSQTISTEELFDPNPTSNKDDITSYESSKAVDKTVPNNLDVNDSNSNLFNDLDSVLNEAGAFPFQSALHGDTLQQLKTPEKLLQSVPPTSIMMEKTTTSETTNRTNFLGALEENKANSNLVSQASTAPMSNLFTQRESTMLHCTLNEIQPQTTLASDKHNDPTDSQSETSDALSSLFSELANPDQKC